MIYAHGNNDVFKKEWKNVESKRVCDVCRHSYFIVPYPNPSYDVFGIYSAFRPIAHHSTGKRIAERFRLVFVDVVTVESP